MKNSGFALLSVIVIVMVISAAAVRLSLTEIEQITRVGWMIRADQTRLLTLSFQERALADLKQDSNAIDSLNEPWAQEKTLTLEDTLLEQRIVDLQGRFNINNLTTQEGRLNQSFVISLGRLFELTGIGREKVSLIIERMVQDQRPRSIAAVSELRGIDGFSESMFSVLSPVLTALPETTALNINTVSELGVLSLSSALTPSLAQRILRYREQTPFKTVQEFHALMAATAPEALQDIRSADLTTSSQWFLIETQAHDPKTPFRLFSLIRRQAGIEIVTRSETSF